MTGVLHPALALVGQWRLTRQIEDVRAGAEVRFEGEALLSRDAGSGRLAPPSPGVGSAAAARVADGAPLPATIHLRWAEEGTLHMGGTQTRARRVYLWRLSARAMVEVAYEDGRIFHAFAMAPGGGADVRHDCAPDLYEGVYAFDAPDFWRLTWRVRGPRKDYRMVTEHRRIA
ncbi:MAG: hypothetical protein ACJAVR_000253 [Paracoccaceae bacterium]|jgi:hypothetical protein